MDEDSKEAILGSREELEKMMKDIPGAIIARVCPF